MTIRCNNCGDLIPDDNDVAGRQPCPNCGVDGGRKYDVSASGGGIKLTGTVMMWSLVAGHTGREVIGNEGYGYATEWASFATRDELLAQGGTEQEFSSSYEHLEGDTTGVVDPDVSFEAYF